MLKIDRLRLLIASFRGDVFPASALPKDKALYSNLSKMVRWGEIEVLFEPPLKKGWQPRKVYREIKLNLPAESEPEAPKTDAWREIWPEFYEPPRLAGTATVYRGAMG